MEFLEFKNHPNWGISHEENELKAIWREITKSKKFRNSVSEEQIRKIITELNFHKPIQYITEEAVFGPFILNVTPSVLIPRPETEELCFIIHQRINGDFNGNFIDIGTGSGAIAIYLKWKFPTATVNAIDISPSALQVAKRNAVQQQLFISFFQEDYLHSNIIEEIQADIVVSNPPYIAEFEKANMDANVLEYEPQSALFPENKNPLTFYQKIATDALKTKTPPRFIFLELNPLLAEETASLFESKYKVEIIPDLQMKKRFLVAELL